MCVATKVEKQVCMWQKIKFVDGIDEKYVDHNKPANGIVHSREGIRQHLIFPFFDDTLKKSLSESLRTSIFVFKFVMK